MIKVQTHEKNTDYPRNFPNFITGATEYDSNCSSCDHGQLVQGQELALLEYLMGTRIPAGRHWLDQNGNWGYEGNPVIQGNIFASQYGNPQPSNSNRSCSSTHYDPSDGSYMIRGSSGCTIVSTPSGSISSC
ncbi:hypothetical protein P7L53_17440 [Thermoleptolyngbya sichuanensis XZ-Cy5]|uniref:hypothetical protein n=1 Tax=Thermoleptolyngbya sichuanensis TaxID=2885951 RepID=UPI00240DF8D7|nr:hypothetical protein [Thermoleptolyngbya sichuanensis]MDG2618026.1 hypothetical protein [Thermoleptolyngbya sichuanensis XZ-Cy5]